MLDALSRREFLAEVASVAATLGWAVGRQQGETKQKVHDTIKREEPKLKLRVPHHKKWRKYTNPVRRPTVA